MTANKKLLKSEWTEKHDAFCLEKKITPCAQLLWRYLLLDGEQEQEPDLTKFNEWVKKYRIKGFHRTTLKTALDQLINCGVVQLLKKFKWCIVRIIARPLEWLLPKKNPPNPNKTYVLAPSNDLTAGQGVDSSSIDPLNCEMVAEMEAVLSECENAGIPFNPEKSPEILEYTLETVKIAIALFLERGGHETDWRGRRKIRNPQGWLLKCLRQGWAEEINGWSFAGLLAALGVKL